MRPWIKFCIIYSSAYSALSMLIYAYSTSKASIWGIVLIGLAFNGVIFLKYRNRPVRIPLKGEIIRLKSPIAGLYENLMGVKK